jgi:hypothetical protein
MISLRLLLLGRPGFLYRSRRELTEFAPVYFVAAGSFLPLIVNLF